MKPIKSSMPLEYNFKRITQLCNPCTCRPGFPQLRSCCVASWPWQDHVAGPCVSHAIIRGVLGCLEVQPSDMRCHELMCKLASTFSGKSRHLGLQQLASSGSCK